MRTRRAARDRRGRPSRHNRPRWPARATPSNRDRPTPRTSLVSLRPETRTAPRGRAPRPPPSDGDVAGAHDVEEIAHRSGTELAADPAQAGIDVRPAHTELAGRLHDGRGLRNHLKEVTLLVGERCDALG